MLDFQWMRLSHTRALRTQIDRSMEVLCGGTLVRLVLWLLTASRQDWHGSHPIHSHWLMIQCCRPALYISLVAPIIVFMDRCLPCVSADWRAAMFRRCRKINDTYLMKLQAGCLVLGIAYFLQEARTDGIYVYILLNQYFLLFHCSHFNIRFGLFYLCCRVNSYLIIYVLFGLFLLCFSYPVRWWLVGI